MKFNNCSVGLFGFKSNS